MPRIFAISSVTFAGRDVSDRWSLFYLSLAILAAVLFLSFLYIVVNLGVDMLYGWLDPRIRYS